MPANATTRLRLALIGPEPGKPCGISDYVQDLLPALQGVVDTVFMPYSAWLRESPPDGIDAALLHYERSLVPDDETMRAACAKYPAVFVVPHEVYDQDPFAFPISKLHSPIPFVLGVKRWLYRRRHPDFFREVELQGRGYHARGVFPLNSPSRLVLEKRFPGNLLATIPLAMRSADKPTAALSRSQFFPKGNSRPLLGVFGFLTPANDYAMVMDLLEAIPGLGLLILGGKRVESEVADRLHNAMEQKGLADRVAITGYIPEAELASHLALPDAFIFPARFKSSSASLLRLLDLGKPIFAADLPLTRELQAQGAPITLYFDPASLKKLLVEFMQQNHPRTVNRYPYTFSGVAEQYVQAMRTVLSPN